MLDSNATIKLLETLPDISVQALNGIRTHDFYVTGAMLSQLSYQSYMSAVVCGFGPLYSVDVTPGSSI